MKKAIITGITGQDGGYLSNDYYCVKDTRYTAFRDVIQVKDTGV